MMQNMAKRTKGRISFGCLFWLIFALLIALLFFLNRKTISVVFEQTDIKSIFLKNKTENAKEETTLKPLPDIQLKEEGAVITGDGSKEAGQNSETIPQVPPVQTADTQDSLLAKPKQTDASDQSADISKETLPGTIDPQSGGISNSKTAASTEQPSVNLPQQTDNITEPISSTEAPLNTGAVPSKPDTHRSAQVRKTVLYWIRIDTDGKLSRQTVIRLLPQSDAPMSDALITLFATPSADELKQGLRTLIPPETKLRSAWVKDGIAFINVSEEFQFNQYGIEGALAQLSQVVFTATEFSTVKAVQILIEGQKKDYLGVEGVWIGSPLSRTSF